MKKIVFLSIFLISSSLFAKGDLSSTLAYRSAPKAGGLKIETGYSLRLWGSGKWTSFIRPFVNLKRSISFSSYGGGLEYYLTQFIGFRAQYDSLENTENYSDFNCLTYRCIDKYTNVLLQAKLYYALGPLYGKFSYEINKLSSELSDKDILWPTIALNLRAGGESYNKYQVILGLKIIKGLRLNFSHESFIISDSKQAKQSIMALTHSFSDSLSVNFGVGNFKSNLYETDLMGVVSLNWKPLRGFLIE